MAKRKLIVGKKYNIKLPWEWQKVIITLENVILCVGNRAIVAGKNL